MVKKTKAPRQQTSESADKETFAALGLEQGLLQSLAELGYEEPTPVQREAIPPLLAGRDLLAEAPTGTGKTAAFALPILQSIGATEGGPAGLVLVPTRELAMQVAEAIHRYGRARNVRVLPVYGGQAIGQQLRALRRGVDIVVATPGRAVDHIGRGSLRLDGVRTLVLDEADEMLAMGFAEDLETILGATNPERQSALFSATISSGIARMAASHLRDPVRVTVVHEATDESRPRVRQTAYVVQRGHKQAALTRLLDMEEPTSVLVFARTRIEVDELAEAMDAHGYAAAPLHGGLGQDQRDRVMGRFRDGTVQLLIATDVAARGLDIENVSHVVNYDIPTDPETYIHRIGRTGRAGRKGAAITLLEPREHRLLRNIERVSKSRIDVARLPTLADLRARRLELLGASLREVLTAGDGLERYHSVLEPLAEEFDIVELALAALSLADTATGGAGGDEADLPQATLGTQSETKGRKLRPGPSGDAPSSGKDRKPKDSARERGVTRLFIGGGRKIGLRPADLVGAIANEAGIEGRVIGAIDIADSFALVEVPEEIADSIVAALSKTKIKGKRLVVRRDRSDGV